MSVWEKQEKDDGCFECRGKRLYRQTGTECVDDWTSRQYSLRRVKSLRHW